MRRLFPLILLLAFAIGMAKPHLASAHAEPERSSPSADGVVPDAPFTVETWFTEEVDGEATSLTVTGPDGMRVDNQDSRLDLNDPERKHVTVTLQPGLGEGTYTVNWTSRSAEDGDTASGFFTFTVGEAVPVASPAGSPVAASSEPTVVPTPIPQPETETENPFPARELGIAVGVGLLAGLGIYLFWRLVRPRA